MSSGEAISCLMQTVSPALMHDRGQSSGSGQIPLPDLGFETGAFTGGKLG